MRMNKKIIAVILGCFVCLLLAGCGEKAPTVEELLANAKSASTAAYQDFDLEMEVKADMSQVSDDQPMNAQGGVHAKGRVEITPSVVHMEGFTMDVAMSGLSMEMQMDVWADQAAGTGYVRTMMFGQDTGWVRSGTDGTTIDASGVAGTLGQFLDGVQGGALAEHKKGEDWVVTGTVDLGSLDIGVPITDENMGRMTGTMALSFDESTRALKSMVLEAGDGETSFYATVSMRSMADQSTLSVPQEVIDKAVENDSEGFVLEGNGLDPGSGFGGEDGANNDPDSSSDSGYVPQDGMFDRGGFDFGG